jgi:hypothetical protein
MFLPSTAFLSDGSPECKEFLKKLLQSESCKKIPIQEVAWKDIGSYLQTERPMAIVFPVTESIMHMDSFSSSVNAITNWMDKSMGTAFRCYIYPLTMEYEEFQNKCDAACSYKKEGLPYNESLYLIQDNIHHAAYSSVEELAAELRQFIKNGDNINNYYGAVKVQIFFKMCAGFLLQTITVLSHFITIGIGLLLSERFAKEIFSSLSGLHETVLGYLQTPFLLPIILAFSICSVFSVTNTVYWLKNGSLNEIAQKMGTPLFLYSYLLLIPVFTLFNLIYKQHIFSILLCISVAFMIDILRRGCYTADRQRVALRKPSIRNKQNLPLSKKILNVRSQISGSPYRIPYLCADRQPVFISYTHSSDWATDKAEELYNELKIRDIPCFLDKKNISRGSSWHRRLKEKLDSASVVISLVDKLSIKNTWPAEELETALLLRSISGSPGVYLLLDKDLELENVEKMPVFEEVIKRSGSDNEIAFVLKEIEKTEKDATGNKEFREKSSVIIASQLARAHSETDSLFGYFGSVILDRMRRPLNILSIFSTSLLWIFLLIAALVNWKLQFFESQIQQGGVVVWVYFLAACFFGTTCLLDLFYHGFMIKPNGITPNNLLIPSIVSIVFAGIIINACIPCLRPGMELVMATFLSVGAAVCSINACINNGINRNSYKYSNEI